MVRRKCFKIAAILYACLLLCPVADGVVLAEKNLVADQAGLFTAAQTTELEQEARDLGAEYNLDIVIVTAEDAGGKSAGEYADDYFDYQGYGVGEERSGLLFLIDLDNREVYISPSGEAIRYLTDERIEGVLDEVFAGGLTDGDMLGAARSFLSATEKYLAAGIPPDQYSVPENAVSPNPYSAPTVVPNVLSAEEGLGGGVVAGLAGLFYFFLTKRGYKGKPQPVVFEFRKNCFVDLNVNSDNLVNTYVTSRIIPKPKPSGSAGGGSAPGRSTIHRSSSGRIHGGGGRKF
ncbi:MAG: TPM domain-containing protein [Clostridia bacterium]|jgi:uncharacterized protein|nr:TPM domain-containing protein [Clostridia bacterium]